MVRKRGIKNIYYEYSICIGDYMKLLKSHDGIALVVLFVIVLSTLVLRETMMDGGNSERNIPSCMDYGDIDSQCPPGIR